MGAPPADSLKKIRIHDHAALFYDNPNELVAAAAPFLRIGLSLGEKCLIYCPPATAEAILSGLRSSGTDIGGALARGSLVVGGKANRGEAGASARPADVVAYLRSTARLARAEKYSGLRLCVDTRFALGKEARGEKRLEYQAKMQRFLEEHDALAMCLHGSRDLADEALLDALRAHPIVIFRGRTLDNFYFAPPVDESGRWATGETFARRLSHLAARYDEMSGVRRQAIRLKRIRDVTGSLLARAAVPDILNGIVEGVISLGYGMCRIGMAKEDGSVETVAGWGDKAESLERIGMRWDDTPKGQSPAGVAIRSGKPDVVHDVVRSRRFSPWKDATSALGFRSVAAVPLGEGGRTVGALVVYAGDAGAFDKEALEELSAFAQQASLVLMRARENRTLRESEEMFRTVVEDTNVFVAEIDPGGRILLFNRAAEKLTGYRAEEILGKDYFTLFIPERERDRVQAAFREILGGMEAEGYVNGILTRDGTERLLSWNTKAVRGAGGEIRGVVGVGVDVTGRLRAEEEKERLQSRLVQAQKMEAVGTLAGGIAHDFNNILGSIVGYASLMEDGMDPADPFLDAATKIRISAERGAELVAKLLGFARKGKYRVRPLSLNDVVADVVAIVSRTFDRSIEIRTALDPSLAPVEGDAGQLEQSLLNLCLNAGDAMPAGGVLTIETGNVRLSAEEAERYHVGGAGPYAVLAVSDTGEGMTDEVRKRIFEPFYTTRKDIGRSGMGLPMVYGIVKNHGGGIHVESEPGRGAVVRIHLPAGRAEPRGTATGEAAPPRGRETILFVDDEPAIRDMGRELLSALGYKALVAEDGEAACRLFRERREEIGLVILDIVMPRMGGKEAFECLRRIDPGVAVLLSSGYAVDGVAREILDAGANGFIRKPYRMAELARAIRGLVSSPRPR